MILQQTKREIEDVEERFKSFFEAQLDLVKDQIREEDSDFKLRLKHEREIRHDALRAVKHQQARQFQQLKDRMLQSSIAVEMPRADTIREDVYDLVTASRKRESKKAKRQRVCSIYSVALV